MPRCHYWSPLKYTRMEDPHPSSITTTRSTIPKDLRTLPPPMLLPLFSSHRSCERLENRCPKCFQSSFSTLSECKIHHHVLHRGVQRFSLLFPSILSFRSFKFYHVLMLVTHHNMLVPPLRITLETKLNKFMEWMAVQFPVVKSSLYFTEGLARWPPLELCVPKQTQISRSWWSLKYTCL